MHATTTTRHSRSVPFSTRPGIAERLGIPYMDPLLLLAAAALIGFSIFTLAQATLHDVPGDSYYYVERQSIYAGLGLIGLFALTQIDYSRFRELRVGIYTLMFASISLVFLFGAAARGSRRSFDLPFFNFQPAELGKVLLVLALAGFVIDGARRGSPRQRTARYLLLGLAPAALVFLQPDLGTSLVLGVVTLAVTLLAGVRWSHFLAITAGFAVMVSAVLVVAPALGTPVLKGYQEERLTSFLHPSQDPRDAGYQQNQAKIAIGSGQKTGRGDQATQTRLDFVPERTTDFIFAVVGERFGFLGAVTLSKNLYGTLVAGGITAMLMFQVFVNVGMSLGIMPITGIPLPLMSYGGSSVLATFLAIGILQSIHMQAQLSQKSREYF